MYGIQIWDSANKSNPNKLRVSQNKIFGLITNAQFYVANQTLRTDLHMKNISKPMIESYNHYHKSLISHQNLLAKNFSS